MKEAIIIFPHQLFKNTDFLPKKTPVYLVEETLFFNQYKFHKQKISFHRASMKFYENYLLENNFKVEYIEATSKKADIRILLKSLLKEDFKQFHITKPTDNWLEKRVNTLITKEQITWYNNALFLNTEEDLASFFKPTKKKFYQTSFYKQERNRRNILIENGNPVGGKWTFDSENRKKYPKGKIPPAIQFPDTTAFFSEGNKYTQEKFSKNYGKLTENPLYPITFKQAESWFDQFLEIRFYEFGVYEDAIVKEASFLNHSLLSPLLNVGLLSVDFVVAKTLKYAKENDIPINSTEGFIRQIIGWREFIRGVYIAKGTEERTKNFWQHKRKIPASFYDGSTGIDPIDDTIKKVIKTGYAHHIERLMIVGNFMVLCEFDPDEVYKWFMELFIDAYDWVMVPNVYGMSLFADGGLMSTKPYISSSNYIKKMSNYPNGDWQAIWDGLFWNFMDKHQEFFKKNPRLSMLANNLTKMAPEKKENHFKNAQIFLDAIDNQLKK